MRAELRAPAIRLTFGFAAILMATFATIALRLAQPSPILHVISATQDGGVIVTVPGHDAPLRLLALLRPGDLPGFANIAALERHLAAHPADGQLITPDLMIEDPDMLHGYDLIDSVLAAQQTLSAMLVQAGREGSTITAVTLPVDGAEKTPAMLPVRAEARSSLGSLPAGFWVQVGAGFVVLTVAAVFLTLRSGRDKRQAAEGIGAFGLAGIGVAGAAFCAAIYSSRPIALDPVLLRALSAGNMVFSYLFGVSMIALFARYPRPLFARAWLWPVALLCIIATFCYQFRLAPWALVTPQNLVAAIFVTILALVAMQWRATRGHPADRAALLWLGLSVLLGAGIFVMLVALPVMIEGEGVMSQGISFIPLCAIYVGTALALARWRLFDLDRWAWRVFFHLAVVVLLVMVDLAFLASLSLSGAASLASAVLVVGLIYFPLRDLWFTRLLAPRRADLSTIYSQTVTVPFQIGRTAKETAWRELLASVFSPLHSTPMSTDETGPPRIEDEGLALICPTHDWASAQKLSYAERGRRLFNAGDAALVAELARLIDTTEHDRAAYEQALHRERLRIARDLHDDVGARLLSSLHSRDDAARQEFLVDALADLRQIASGLAGREITLATLVAEMRHESRNRAEAHGFTLDWPLGPADEAEIVLSYGLHRNFTAMHREALSNAFSHGTPGPVRVATSLDGATIRHEITNPCAASANASRGGKATRGNGLANLATRAEGLGGRIEAHADNDRFRLTMALPLTGICG